MNNNSGVSVQLLVSTAWPLHNKMGERPAAPDSHGEALLINEVVKRLPLCKEGPSEVR